MTPVQLKLLLSFGEEFPEDDLPKRADSCEAQYESQRERFLRVATDIAFDWQVLPSEIRVAQKLQDLGYLRDVQPHGGPSGRECLEVVFTREGAEELFDRWTSRHLVGVWVVYLLECQDGSLYTGVTDDIMARWKAHLAGKGAKYTRSHPPKRIHAYRVCENRSAAQKLEFALKQLPRADKLRAWAV